MDFQSDGIARGGETTYGPSALRIVMVSVNRKYGHGDIQVWVLIIDCGETWGSGSTLTGLLVDSMVEWWKDLRCTGDFTLIRVTQKFDLNWSVT